MGSRLPWDRRTSNDQIAGALAVSAPPHTATFERDANQDANVAIAPVHDQPHQSLDPTFRRIDAGIRSRDLPWPSHGPHLHLPINVFERGEHYIFVLTYGSESQWVKNVLAAGGCEIRVRGRDVRLVEPELIMNPPWELLPRPVQLIERLAGVTEFLRMRAA